MRTASAGNPRMAPSGHAGRCKATAAERQNTKPTTSQVPSDNQSRSNVQTQRPRHGSERATQPRLKTSTSTPERVGTGPHHGTPTPAPAARPPSPWKIVESSVEIPTEPVVWKCPPRNAWFVVGKTTPRLVGISPLGIDLARSTLTGDQTGQTYKVVQSFADELATPLGGGAWVGMHW